MNRTESSNSPLEPAADIAAADEQPISDSGVDYVMPKESFKKSQKRSKKKRRHPSHSGRTTRASREEYEASLDGYIFKTPGTRRHRKHMKKSVRILLIILIVVLALVIGTVSTYFILRSVGRDQVHDYDAIDITLPEDSTDFDESDELDIDDNGRIIRYNGSTYALNDDIAVIAFIGVDHAIDNEELSMADAIYLMAINTDTGEVKVVSVSRDTMTDVAVYSNEGAYIDTSNKQIAYSYSYTGQGITGAMNTATSISRLFFGLPVSNYFAINLDAMLALNDSIGGVTLVSSITFTSPVDGRTIYAGDEVTLIGKEAEYYVRTRDTGKLNSNDDRMRRQREYITAFMDSMIPAIRRDIGTVSELYNTVKVNADTNLNMPKLTYLASTAVSMVGSGTDVDFLSIEGTFTAGEYAEFHADDKQLLELMLSVFYRPVDE